MLSPAGAALLEASRRAVLATIAASGRARLVPIAYAVDLDGGVLYSALDEKAKSVADPRELARVRDVLARPQVSVLVDRWSEDWSELAWLRLDGEASILEPSDPAGAAEHAHAVGLLRRRYPQYADQRLEERPILRVALARATSWAAR
ncbi:MAG: TIGR03668 family PPOX class F420-dependent oxidoreductase [Chloroflexota bacterium]|nr:TIGR03668 family PPOX class F420-dependent oxidoreductase [Chloroflexota bacterium]